MPRFAGIGYYDLANLFASYIGKHRAGLVDSPAPHHHKVRVLELLNDREETEAFKQWKQAQALLQRAAARFAELERPAEVQFLYILAFEPGAYADWNEEEMVDPDGFMRVYVLLNPSPNFRLYSSEDSIVLPPWGATVVDHRGPVSASNFNAPNTAHVLVMELALDVPR